MIGLAVGSILLVTLGTLYGLGLEPFARNSSPPAPSGTSGGFSLGQAVTLEYSGGSECTPSLGQLYPAELALNATTHCEMGDAVQGAIRNEVPQWLLVPAFAGLSAFNDLAAGATSQGFPSFSGAPVLTDCAAGPSPLRCPQTPTVLYSPNFVDLETIANLTGGLNGLPMGLLPTPAHDVLVNTTGDRTDPVPWGTIIVLVFDPNIFPQRTNGACAATVASNLTIPTGHCLTTVTALDQALVTSSSSVTAINGGSANNSVWKAFGSPVDQVYVVNDFTPHDVDTELNSNLYQSFGVSTTLPTFPGS
ncbi:MAG: hypothetical protein L3K08_00125 [Thermoplasmata archaeon]|nr:hypothetical protein [Thermoplasmata archaeon]